MNTESWFLQRKTGSYFNNFSMQLHLTSITVHNVLNLRLHAHTRSVQKNLEIHFYSKAIKFFIHSKKQKEKHFR